MKRVFDLIDGAKQAVLFLAFDPGNNSILDAAGKALAKNPDLFVRGALTSPQRAMQFLGSPASGRRRRCSRRRRWRRRRRRRRSRWSANPASRRRRAPNCPRPSRTSAPCRPAPSTPTTPSAPGKPSSHKFGFAIIHNKIVVIDPFSDNCTVVTGSHNLGFRASHNNDENMVIVRGHRGLAEAYACHVLDLYDHYAWRFLLKQASGDLRPAAGGRRQVAGALHRRARTRSRPNCGSGSRPPAAA